MANAAARRRAAIRARNRNEKKNSRERDAQTAQEAADAQAAEEAAAAERRAAAKARREQRQQEIRDALERGQATGETPGRVMRRYLKGEYTAEQATDILANMTAEQRQRAADKYPQEYMTLKPDLPVRAERNNKNVQTATARREGREARTENKKRSKNRAREQASDPKIVGGAAGNALAAIPTDMQSQNDLMLSYLNLDYLTAMQRIMAPDREQRFYDEYGLSYNQETRQKYTYEDYARARAENRPWTIDETQLLGPVFRARGSDNVLSLLDQQAIASGAVSGAGVPSSAYAEGDKTQTIAEFNDEMFSWFRKGNAMGAEFQRMLYDAGYYDDIESDYEDGMAPQYGVLDADTLEAASNFITDAITTGLALDIDVFEMLDQRAASRTAQRESAAAAEAASKSSGGGGGGSGSPTQLTDEAAIRQLGDTVGQEVYGRRLTADESAQVVAAIQQADMAEAAAIESNATYEAVTPEARIRKLLRDLNPAQAQGTDIAGAFSMFANIMQSGLGLGSNFGTSDVSKAGGGGGVFASPTMGG